MRRLVRTLGAMAERMIQRRGLPAAPRFVAGQSPVTYLVWNVFSVGGTVRTVTQQASWFAAQGHRVTIVSVVRRDGQGDRPFFDLDPRVRIETLVDRARMTEQRGPVARVERWLDARPPLSTHAAIGRSGQASLLTELRVLRRLQRVRGVVVGTRTNLNLAIARFAPARVLRVVQEHLYLDLYAPEHRAAILRHYGRCDVIACLTHADADAYRRGLPDRSSARVEVVPNAVRGPFGLQADPRHQRIIAVGRVTPNKGFAALIDAFALVADRHPEWRLAIIGPGRHRRELRRRAEEHGLADRVDIPGARSDVPAELIRSSIYAMTSRFEAFGIVLLEAMAAGLCVVGFPAEPGPKELLRRSGTALLAPPGDIAALADRLDQAMGDEQLRRRLGSRARAIAEGYTDDRVLGRWDEILAAADRRGRRPDSVHVGTPRPAPS